MIRPIAPFLKRLSFLAICGLFVFMIGDRLHVAKFVTLNVFMPSSYAALAENNAVEHPPDLGRTVRYYRIIFLLTKEKDGALSLLGFCFSIEGQDKRAIQYFRKSVGLKPAFFWSHYNLGLLHMKQQDLDHASRELAQAIASDPVKAMESIYASKVYTDIIAGLKLSPKDMAERLERGFRQADQLLSLIRKVKAGELPLEAVPALLRSVHVQIF